MTIEHSAGIHGQTFLTSDLERSSRFLTELLGLSLRKQTVHHHDWRLPVSHFGFPAPGQADAAAPGVVTYIEWSPVFYAPPATGLADARQTSDALDAPQVGDFKSLGRLHQPPPRAAHAISRATPHVEAAADRRRGSRHRSLLPQPRRNPTRARS